MFDISLAEMAIVVVVAVIAIGPKELPAVIRAIGKGFRQLNALTNELRGAWRDLTRESGLDDVRDDIDREVRLITGDDGKQYASYDIPQMTAKPKGNGDE